MAQMVAGLTLGFSSGDDLRVEGSSPALGAGGGGLHGGWADRDCPVCGAGSPEPLGISFGLLRHCDGGENHLLHRGAVGKQKEPWLPELWPCLGDQATTGVGPQTLSQESPVPSGVPGFCLGPLH